MATGGATNPRVYGVRFNLLQATECTPSLVAQLGHCNDTDLEAHLRLSITRRANFGYVISIYLWSALNIYTDLVLYVVLCVCVCVLECSSLVHIYIL